MKRVKITVMRITRYEDLMAEFENPIEHACDIEIGKCFICENGQKPDKLCDEAWKSMEHFVLQYQ